LRLINFCITQLKAQGPSRTCNESKEEEEEEPFTSLMGHNTHRAHPDIEHWLQRHPEAGSPHTRSSHPARDASQILYETGFKLKPFWQ